MSERLKFLANSLNGAFYRARRRRPEPGVNVATPPPFGGENPESDTFGGENPESDPFGGENPESDPFGGKNPESDRHREGKMCEGYL